MEIIRPQLSSASSHNRTAWNSQSPKGSMSQVKKAHESTKTSSRFKTRDQTQTDSRREWQEQRKRRQIYLDSDIPVTSRISRDNTSSHSNNGALALRLKRPQGLRSTSDLQLPSFKDLGISSSEPVYLTSSLRRNGPTQDGDSPYQPEDKSNQENNLYGKNPPPTPPDETATATWISAGVAVSESINNASSPGTAGGQDLLIPGGAPLRSTNIDLPGPTGQDIAAGFSARAAWLQEPARMIASSLTNAQSLSCVELISQVLPSQSKERRMRPTYEEVLTIVQEQATAAPFITITHGVTQAMAMNEIPKTPPTTPFAVESAASHYFADHQTIFSNAAVIPIYHGFSHDLVGSPIARPRYISAPYRTNITILERYIPPTSPEEIEDFFAFSSNRSYLADRLPELALGAGSLLLVYPTKAGGSTFANKYLGPVLDPLLREFVILNNLTVDAAEKLGQMEAVDAMLAFEEMKTRIENLCNSISQGAMGTGQRSPRSKFELCYSETAEIVPDRNTWINWWIDQEQPRLRQNLVEYHQQGGRMSSLSGSERNESTVGMLTRDIVDGVKKSKTTAGSVGIEVGVFVIRRIAL